MKIKLPDSITSAQDLSSVILELKNYSKWLSHDSIKRQLGSKKPTDKPELSNMSKDVVRLLDIEISSSRQIEEIINSLINTKNMSKSIYFTLAAPAPNSLKTTLVKWCRSNISPDILVSFDFNSNILGGVVVRYGSRIFDWSFRRQILASRGDFVKVMKNV